jgi:hypothetical protein
LYTKKSGFIGGLLNVSHDETFPTISIALACQWNGAVANPDAVTLAEAPEFTNGLMKLGWSWNGTQDGCSSTCNWSGPEEPDGNVPLNVTDAELVVPPSGIVVPLDWLSELGASVQDPPVPPWAK